MGHFFISAFYNRPVAQVIQFYCFCIKIDFRGAVGDILSCFHSVTLCNAESTACSLLLFRLFLLCSAIVAHLQLSGE